MKKVWTSIYGGKDEFIRLPTNAEYSNYAELVSVWALVSLLRQLKVTQNNLSNRRDIYVGDDTNKFLPYQLSKVV